MSVINYNLTGIEVLVGEGAISGLKQEMQKLNVSKPLIVTDYGIVASGIVAEVENYLRQENIQFSIYSGVLPDPKDVMVDAGLAIYKETGCDFVLSVGGGSSMDTGKCISIMTVHPGHILDYARSTPDHKDFTRKGCPIISVATTSGTGSEVSKYAVITNAKTNRKTTIASKYILSDVAILDVNFAVKMPQDVTAYTGIDALTHAIDAYTYKTTIDNAVMISDSLALSAIRIIGENLVECYKNGSNKDSRTKMMWASLMAGVALNIGSGESHAFGSMLSKYYGVHHGISVGVSLPYCMQYSLDYAPHRFADIAIALGSQATRKTDELAEESVHAVKRILKDLDFPHMSDYVHSIDEVRKFADECAGNSCCTSNERMVNGDQIIQVFKMALEDNYD